MSIISIWWACLVGLTILVDVGGRKRGYLFRDLVDRSYGLYLFGSLVLALYDYQGRLVHLLILLVLVVLIHLRLRGIFFDR